MTMSAPRAAASARAARALARLPATSPTVGLSCASAMVSSLTECVIIDLPYQAAAGIDSFGASPHAASPPGDRLMDILASIRKMLVPIHREGYVFILAGLAAMLVLGWVWQPLFWLCGLITAWIIYFFRDPPRVTP